MISIVSIPHTGTKFTEKLIRSLGYDTRHAHFHSEHPSQNAHLWRSEGAKIVVPWRAPDLSRISSLNRGEEPRPYAEFQALRMWSESDDIHFFDVDAATEADRTEQVRGLCAFLGCAVPAEVDWTPVNTSKDVTGLKASYTG